jgi:hypothetical protein
MGRMGITLRLGLGLVLDDNFCFMLDVTSSLWRFKIYGPFSHPGEVI